MPSTTPPTEDEIREQLRQHGIENFGQLVSEAARLLKQRNDVDSSRWYVLFGDMFVFVIDMEPWA